MSTVLWVCFFYNREASPMPAIFMMMWVSFVAKIFHTPPTILGFFFSTPLFLKKIKCLLFSRGLKIHCHCKNCSEHKCLNLPGPESYVLALFPEVSTEIPVLVCFPATPRECQIHTLITHYFENIIVLHNYSAQLETPSALQVWVSLWNQKEGSINAWMNCSKGWRTQVVCFTMWNQPSDICLPLVKIRFSHFSFNLSSQLFEYAWQELWQRNTDKISIKYDWIIKEMKEWSCTLWSIYSNVKGTCLPLVSLKLF